MLKLIPEASFAAKAYIPIPGQEKDAVLPCASSSWRRRRCRPISRAFPAEKTVMRSLRIVVGWEGVDKPFSAENLRTLLAGYPMAALAFFEAFRSEILKAKSGN